MTPEAVALLAEILRGTPSLPGALCADWPATFAATEDGSDPDTRQYAAMTALRLCRACSAMTQCRAYFDSLPPSERPPGVVAGQISTPTGKDTTRMTTFNPDLVNDTTRAARFVAAWAAEDESYIEPIREAKRDGRVLELAIALAVRCAQLAKDLYGDRIQVELDGWALDALWFEEREALKREVERDDDA